MSVKEYLPYVNNLFIYGTTIALQNWEFIRSDSGRLTFLYFFFFSGTKAFACIFLILLSHRSCAGVECNQLPLTLQRGVANE